jgi:hypothetical protein
LPFLPHFCFLRPPPLPSEKNRFKNVVVIPEADVIRAQAPDGSNIIIEITPDQLTGVVVGSGSTADQKTMHSPRSGGDFE